MSQSTVPPSSCPRCGHPLLEASRDGRLYYCGTKCYTNSLFEAFSIRCDQSPECARRESSHLKASLDSCLRALEGVLEAAEGMREQLERYEGFSGEPTALSAARAALAKFKGGVR